MKMDNNKETTEITLHDRALLTQLSTLMGDITTYVINCTADTYHDKWEEWTARMDDVREELDKIRDIVDELEEHSVDRRNQKRHGDYRTV